MLQMENKLKVIIKKKAHVLIGNTNKEAHALHIYNGFFMIISNKGRDKSCFVGAYCLNLLLP